jgi:hypothetical protein
MSCGTLQPMSDPHQRGSNGSKPDLSRSRFFCNNARKGSLVCGVLAFAALVVGGGFAEISSNGSPTSAETAVVRYVILGSLLIGVALYVIGGRMLRDDHGTS